MTVQEILTALVAEKKLRIADCPPEDWMQMIGETAYFNAPNTEMAPGIVVNPIDVIQVLLKDTDKVVEFIEEPANG